MFGRLFFSYLFVINLISFILFGVDKWNARRGKGRIAERDLLIVSCMGGAFGALGGMYLFRHKTLHTKFMICVPIFAFIWLFALLYVVYRMVF